MLQAVTLPVWIVPYGIYVMAETCVHCFTPQLSEEVDSSLKDLQMEYESWRRSDQPFQHQMVLFEQATDQAKDRKERHDAVVKAAKVAQEIRLNLLKLEVEFERADEEAVERQKLLDATELLMLEQAFLAANPPLLKPHDDWKIRQLRNDAEDAAEQERYAAEEARPRIPGDGPPQRRRARTHAGLFDAVDYCKSQIPVRMNPTEAIKQSARELISRYMKTRNWRTSHVARWLDVAVWLATTPSKDEIDAACGQHGSSTRARFGEFGELAGAPKQC